MDHKLLILSPYHSGSHQVWADGYARRSRFDVTLLTLPGQLWKWRMHGAAVTLARQLLDRAEQPDLILADDMLDLATFLGLTRRQIGGAPAVLYMHENQLTYPLPAGKGQGPMRRNMGLRERQYVLINWKAMLAADEIWFNSRHHLDSWFAALPVFLRHYPDQSEEETVTLLAERSVVMPVGIDLQRLARSPSDHGSRPPSSAPLILWNQRWEFDKNPAAFFQTLRAIQDEGLPFRLALCGENFQQEPALFVEAQAQFAAELVHVGYAAPETYRELLWAADIVLSTARHEFFGISILEAIFAATFPILPSRLSYPELIPPEFHGRCLYRHADERLALLRWALTHPREAKETAVTLSARVALYDWQRIAVQYDQKMAGLLAAL